MGWIVLFNLGAVAAILTLAHRRAAAKRRRVLVVGSINVDLYQRTAGGQADFAGKVVNLLPIKGMTLPAASFVAKARARRRARHRRSG